jgi:hypothetical protein
VVLTLDRPHRLNAMTATMFRELEATVRHLDREDGLRVLIVTGAGRAFCAGYDLADAEKLHAQDNGGPGTPSADGLRNLQPLASRYRARPALWRSAGRPDGARERARLLARSRCRSRRSAGVVAVRPELALRCSEVLPGR